MELLTQTFVLFVTLFTMMVGLIFTVIPPLPGTVIIWGAAIGYGLIVGWEKLGWWAFGILTVLMIAGIIADVLGGQFGAKLGGASCFAIFLGTVIGFVAGIIASFIGTPILGCLAGVFGTLGGILLIERLRYGNWQAAMDATRGFLAGTGVGVAAKIASGLLMFAVFLTTVYLIG